MFLQHDINGVMYRKEEAGDSLNNKLERNRVCQQLGVLMFSIILSCVTEVPVRHGRGGGSVIAAFFWPIIT